MRLLLALSRRILPVIVTTAGLSGGVVAHAASVSLCVPSAPNKAVTSASKTGSCAAASTAVALPASSTDQQTLLSILPHVSFQASGVGGKPTIQFSGMNLQVVNGSGSETTLNGEGNLVIGYDPAPITQTGSHNLVMGTEGQSYTSYGGLLAGSGNHIIAPRASVTGGEANTAGGQNSWVGGGTENQATGFGSAVSGGDRNGATGPESSIFGGDLNLASGAQSAVAGGLANTASGFESTAAGVENTASGENSSVSGSLRESMQLNSNNWSTPGCCNSRSVKWYTDGSGIVHLEGAVTQTNPESVGGSNPNQIANLPPEARPPQTVYTIAHTNFGTYTDIAITPEGDIFAIAPRPPAVTDFFFVSLEGITYRQ
jgi:hypothetical protein